MHHISQSREWPSRIRSTKRDHSKNEVFTASPPATLPNSPLHSHPTVRFSSIWNARSDQLALFGEFTL